MSLHAQSPPPEGVLDQLLSLNHGWWCQYIEDVTSADGTPTSKLVGVPHIDLTFYDLYGYPPGEKIPTGATAVFKEDRRRLISAMREAMAVGSAARTERVRMQTAVGMYKSVEVFFRRIRLPDGKPALASLHTFLPETGDAAHSMQEVHQPAEQLGEYVRRRGYTTHLQQEILGKLEAYVFLKRYSPAEDKYLFEYVNDSLAIALGLTSPSAAEGRSDGDYFEEELELKNFRTADDEVFRSRYESVRVVREESFTPMAPDRAAGKGGQTRRLMTIKTQYRPRHWENPGDNRVLGVAFDVTDFTDMLRAVAELSDDAIYVKDANHQYQMVNTRFLKMLGLSDERLVEGKTFEQVADQLPGRSDRLIREIDAEDAELFELQETVSHVRKPVTDSLRGPWVTVKKLYKSRANRNYILGNARPLFDYEPSAGEVPLARSLWPWVVARFPQRVSVKQYYPPELEPDERRRFRIKWGNMAFVQHHVGRTVNGKLVTDVIDLSDYDLWPEDQADDYRRGDMRALRTTQEVESSPGWDEKTEVEQWEILQKSLHDQEAWEFPELQGSRGEGKGQTRLQTTKWAMKLGNNTNPLNPPTWFVVVISSDTTRLETAIEKYHKRAETEIKEYHKQTVHIIRNDILPAHFARKYLQDFIETGDANLVGKAKEHISVACCSLSDFLYAHPHLLTMSPKLTALPVHRISTIIEETVKVARYGGNKDIRIECDDWPSKMVSIDVTFFKYVIKELIGNAQKSLETLQDLRSYKVAPGGDNVRDSRSLREVPADYVPMITIRVVVEQTDCVLKVIDTGVACYSDKHRKDLDKQFKPIADNEAEPNGRERIGLGFCSTIIEKHGGRLELSPQSNQTEITITLPLA